jgi:hypothetical protein
MGALDLLKGNYAEIGKSFIELDFSSDPIWQDLSSGIMDCSSSAILDNTTLHNALMLMKAGLAEADSFRAALLPDLVVLFFVLSHFDCILLLDHGLPKEDLELLDEWMADFGVMTRFDWHNEIQKHKSLKDDLYLKFNSIQAEFRSNGNLHAEWKNTWATLLNQPGIHPIYFTRDIDTLLQSPEHPLQAETKELSINWLNVINEGLPEEARKPWRRMNISINSDMQNSTLASYHTYRSIFLLRSRPRRL